MYHGRGRGAALLQGEEWQISSGAMLLSLCLGGAGVVQVNVGHLHKLLE